MTGAELMRTARLLDDTNQASRYCDFKTPGFHRRFQCTVPMMARKTRCRTGSNQPRRFWTSRLLRCYRDGSHTKTLRDLPGAPRGASEDKDPNDTRKEGGAEDTDFGHRKE